MSARRLTRRLTMLATALAAACAPEPLPPGLLVGLGLPTAATAILSVEDDRGAPAPFDVRVGDATYRAIGQLDLPCGGQTGVRCEIALTLDPGSYRFAADVRERDRCGTVATTVTLSSGVEPVTVTREEQAAVTLRLDRTDLDDDDDGIVNALERAVCGRFDAADGALPPQACLDPDDACCSRAPSSLQGQRGAFAGGDDHVRADGTTTTVAPFALDATEATWATFARCVAAGRCLFGDSEHPARQRLADATLVVDAPVTGLLPREAEALCRFQGGRLPDDDEWDFAAAHRVDGGRGRYPFDVVGADGGDGAAVVGCREGGGLVAANHAARGQDCPDGPERVGSYGSTLVDRGQGRPLADLAGNVAEWTVERDPDAPPAPPDESSGRSSRSGVAVELSEPFPDGVLAVLSRGGAAGGIVELLENDVRVRVVPTSPDVDARLRGLAATTGVRCAYDIVDLAAAAALVVEPFCGEP